MWNWAVMLVGIFLALVGAFVIYLSKGGAGLDTDPETPTLPGGCGIFSLVLGLAMIITTALFWPK